MNIQEITDLADQLIFNKTGKHLDDLQIQILKEVFEGKKYAKIARNCNCTEGYVKTVASDLWKSLSEQMGEPIRKSNFKSVMERFYNSNSFYS
jgi:DNA-directed RNA polymerase specialized sigma24 family protein